MEKGFYRSFRKDTFFLLFTFLYTTSLVVPQILCSPIVAGTKMSLLLILMSIYKNSYLLWSSTAPFILSFLSLALFHLFLLWTMCNTSSCQEHTSSFSLTVAGELTQQLRWFLCIVGKRCCSDKNDRALESLGNHSQKHRCLYYLSFWTDIFGKLKGHHIWSWQAQIPDLTPSNVISVIVDKPVQPSKPQIFINRY